MGGEPTLDRRRFRRAVRDFVLDAIAIDDGFNFVGADDRRGVERPQAGTAPRQEGARRQQHDDERSHLASPPQTPPPARSWSERGTDPTTFKVGYARWTGAMVAPAVTDSLYQRAGQILEWIERRREWDNGGLRAGDGRDWSM